MLAIPQNVHEQQYCYKMKIFNALPNKKHITHELHGYHVRFASVQAVKEELRKFDDRVSGSASFSVRYFEGRHQTKHWLIIQEDLQKMYDKY